MKRAFPFYCFFLLFFFTVAGCCPYFSGNEKIASGYIRPTKPASAQRILGKYPGVPDDQGIVTIQVVGKGVPPSDTGNTGQGLLLAERAATIDGYRKLSEKIRGIYIQAYTSGGKYMVDNDVMRSETETWLRGAEIIETRHASHGIIEVTMQVKIYVSPDHIIYRYYTRPGRYSASSSSGEKIFHSATLSGNP